MRRWNENQIINIGTQNEICKIYVLYVSMVHVVKTKPITVTQRPHEYERMNVRSKNDATNIFGRPLQPRQTIRAMHRRD